MRWAGGKRWLLPYIEAIIEAWEPEAFFEPFAGGAAVYLGFDWPRPTVNDVNEELIATYRAISQDPRAVAAGLAALTVSRDEYEDQRLSRPVDDVRRAVRLLYLNRCAYGGVYRTDKAGRFNVPYSGDRGITSLWQGSRLEKLSTAFASASLTSGDFEDALRTVDAGSFVYCDPAYSLPGGERTFRRYGPSRFTWTDQERLAAVAHELAGRGALVAISNGTDPQVARLYSGAVVTRLERRIPFPKANGGTFHEALYVLGGNGDRRPIRAQLRRIAAG